MFLHVPSDVNESYVSYVSCHVMPCRAFFRCLTRLGTSWRARMFTACAAVYGGVET